jgi:hypothetical protein
VDGKVGKLDISEFEKIYGGSKPVQTAAAAPRWKTPGKSPAAPAAGAESQMASRLPQSSASPSAANDVAKGSKERALSSPVRTLKFTGSSFKKEGATQKPKAQEPAKPVKPEEPRESAISKLRSDVSKAVNSVKNLFLVV